MKATITKIHGVNTRYFSAGDTGPRVLLLHGVGLSGASWLRNIDELGKNFTVCAPDLLGCGFTEWPDPPPGPPHPHVLEHLIALVRHLGWDEFHVVGSSFGALIAALLYLEMPERVKKLVAISSGSFVASDEELSVTMKATYANGRSAIKEATLANCRARMERILYDPASVPDELVFAQLTEYALPWALPSFEVRMQGMMDVAACRPYRIYDRCADVALPTLFVWGLNDPRAAHSRAQEMVKQLPNAKLVAFDRCKHYPHIEHAAVFNDFVKSFLLDENFDVPEIV